MDCIRSKKSWRWNGLIDIAGQNESPSRTVVDLSVGFLIDHFCIPSMGFLLPMEPKGGAEIRNKRSTEFTPPGSVLRLRWECLTDNLLNVNLITWLFWFTENPLGLNLREARLADRVRAMQDENQILKHQLEISQNQVQCFYLISTEHVGFSWQDCFQLMTVLSDDNILTVEKVAFGRQLKEQNKKFPEQKVTFLTFNKRACWSNG